METTKTAPAQATIARTMTVKVTEEHTDGDDTILIGLGSCPWTEGCGERLAEVGRVQFCPGCGGPVHVIAEENVEAAA